MAICTVPSKNRRTFSRLEIGSANKPGLLIRTAPPVITEPRIEVRGTDCAEPRYTSIGKSALQSGTHQKATFSASSVRRCRRPFRHLHVLFQAVVAHGADKACSMPPPNLARSACLSILPVGDNGMRGSWTTASGMHQGATYPFKDASNWSSLRV
jgi:hypothetical protein